MIKQQLGFRKQQLLIQRVKLIKQISFFERETYSSWDIIQEIKTELKIVEAKLEEVEMLIKALEENV